MFNLHLDTIPFVCFAHRGASGHEPENTLLSFSKAIELGSPWIELDVHSIEGELLVIHDDQLGRTTSGRGRLTDTSLEVLRSLDAGKGQQIPTLHEVIQLVGDRAGINIELKGPETAEPVVELLASISNDHPAGQFLISSFEHAQLKRIRQLLPAQDLGVLFQRTESAVVTRTLDLGATRLHIPGKQVSRRIIVEAHAANLKVHVYTVDDPGEIQRMMDLGVDGVFSNFPDRVMACIANMSSAD